jgi:hypothetical protein
MKNRVLRLDLILRGFEAGLVFKRDAHSFLEGESFSLLRRCGWESRCWGRRPGYIS